MAYVVGVVFLGLLGFFFVSSVSSPFAEASAQGFLIPGTFLMVLLSPLLTMRLLSEEQKLGTLELLMTAPVRDHEVVLGKFLAALVIFLVTIALSIYFVILLFWFGDPDLGPLLSGYLGFILFSAASLSVGLLGSSLSNNQIVAAVISFGILLVLVLLNQIGNLIEGAGAEILTRVSLQGHFDDFARGVIDTGGLLYYIIFTAVVLFITIRLVESRRWR